jgi:hypothetical protein
MALIYAFRDEAGQSHGDPDSTLDGSPTTGTLSVPPTAGVTFAGQVLEVRYASMEASPGPHPYPLDGGRRMYPTDEVHELLCAAGCWN